MTSPPTPTNTSSTPGRRADRTRYRLAMTAFEAQGVRKTYGGVVALHGADFTVRPGSVHALLGENGAGKSTLVKVMTGAVRPDSGTVRLDGTEVRFHTTADAVAHGVAVVAQELSLFLTSTSSTTSSPCGNHDAVRSSTVGACESWPLPCSRSWGSSGPRTPRSASSRWLNASWSRSPKPSWPSRESCCSTSPRPPSRPGPASASSRSCASCASARSGWSTCPTSSRRS